MNAGWSSSEYAGNETNNAWKQNFSDGNQNNNNKNNTNYVRAVRDFKQTDSMLSGKCPTAFFNQQMQLSLFELPYKKEQSVFQASSRKGNDITLQELFNSYFECRKNKRNTANALVFETDYENNLVQLYEEINDGTYEIGRSIAFIVDKPVKREIFAADFRDRVVHHFIIGKLNHLFEKQFIHDSYSCRVGKGTHFGIQRIDKFIRQCSANYTKDCFILKLDLQGFFMSINKNILFTKLEKFIKEKFDHP